MMESESANMSGLSEKEASKKAALSLAFGVIEFLVVVALIILLPVEIFFGAVIVGAYVILMEMHKAIKKELMNPTNKDSDDV